MGFIFGCCWCSVYSVRLEGNRLLVPSPTKLYQTLKRKYSQLYCVFFNTKEIVGKVAEFACYALKKHLTGFIHLLSGEAAQPSHGRSVCPKISKQSMSHRHE